MTKFKSVLNDDQAILYLAAHLGLRPSDGDLKSEFVLFAKRIEQAVLAKLAEQEPAVWMHRYDSTKTITAREKYLLPEQYKLYTTPFYAHPRVALVGGKTACLSQNGKCDAQTPDGTVIDVGTRNYTVRCNDCWWHGSEDELALTVAADYPDDDATKVCPQCKKIGCLMDLDHSEQQVDLARLQNCGCVVCHCENEDQCLGCGAKSCGTHEVGEIPDPIYADHIPDAGKMIECAKCGHPAIHYLVMDNLGYPNKTPLCGDCTQEHEHLAQDTNEHEMRNFGGAYGLVTYHYEPLGTTQPDHIPDAGEMVPQGWQLVPKEPSRDMLKRMFYEIFGMDGIDEEYLAARYRNMLSSFPKYTEVIND